MLQGYRKGSSLDLGDLSTIRMTAACRATMLTSCEILYSRNAEVLVETLDRARDATVGDAGKVMGKIHRRRQVRYRFCGHFDGVDDGRPQMQKKHRY